MRARSAVGGAMSARSAVGERDPPIAATVERGRRSARETVRVEPSDRLGHSLGLEARSGREPADRTRRAGAQRRQHGASDLPQRPGERGPVHGGRSALAGRGGERAPWAKGARVAPRFRAAHHPTEVHHGLVPRGRTTTVEPLSCGKNELVAPHLVRFHAVDDPGPDAAHVRVDSGHGHAECQARDRCRRVFTDARQGAQRSRIARHDPVVICHDRPRGLVQRDGPARVAEPSPGPQHVGPRRARERSDVGEDAQESLERRSDPCCLRLLQHHLADEHGVSVGVPRTRVNRPPPRVDAPAGAVPGEQGFPCSVAGATLLLGGRVGRACHDRDP